MIPTLSEAQIEMLELLAAGKGEKEIADLMGTSVATVKQKKARLFRLVGVRKGPQATAWWIRHKDAVLAQNPASVYAYFGHFVRGEFETAFENWRALAEDKRPAEARVIMALMYVLRDRLALADMEAERLGPTDAHLYALVREWLDGHPGAPCQRFVQTLETPLRWTGLLAVSYAAHRLDDQAAAAAALKELVREFSKRIERYT